MNSILRTLRRRITRRAYIIRPQRIMSTITIITTRITIITGTMVTRCISA